MLGLWKTEAHTGEKGLDLRRPLPVCRKLRNLLLADAFPLSSAHGFDDQGHEAPSLVDLLESPGLPQHRDHGGEVP